MASSHASKSEDLQDLLWMKNNLRLDIMADPATLKKCWEDGRVTKIVKNAPAMKEVFVELGLIAAGEEENVRPVCFYPSTHLTI